MSHALRMLSMMVLMVAGLAPRAIAQDFIGPPTPSAQSQAPTLDPPLIDSDPTLNPLAVLDQAGRALPGTEPDSGISAAMSVMLLLTVLTLAPAIMLMTTCFLRITIVLALLRQALGTASIPPPQVITALSLFMTLLVMAPTFERVWDEAAVPYQNGEIAGYEELWNAARQPLRDYMFAQIDQADNWSSVYMVLDYRGVDTSDPAILTRADVTTTDLIPAYMLSELKVAFLMGFKVYLPFLVIDMVIASVLISMSMMMLPPVLISLPFKLLLFVLVDGWTLVVGGLLHSFAPPEVGQVSLQLIPALPAPSELVSVFAALTPFGT